MPLWVAIDSNAMVATRRISGVGGIGVVDGNGLPGD
jgi:hypothetical protein